LPTGYQSYVFNTRRAKLADARVREAIGLAMDFDWMSRLLFYGQYKRVNGLFGNTDCAATGTPSPEELALLEPLKAQLPAAVFGPMTVPPNSDGQDRLRENLRRAMVLLKDAGWTVQNGKMRNAKGEALVLEYLDSQETRASTITALTRNLAKIGIEFRLRATDFALYQQRVDKFDYDIISIAFQGSSYPGQELAEIFGSKAADIEGSGNYAGVKSPAVDTLIDKVVTAQNKAELVPACRAFERAIAHSHYLMPQWYSGQHNVAYNPHKLARPAVTPKYYRADGWLIDTWWAK
jgi:microcin C transport system substrate-binding protein